MSFSLTLSGPKNKKNLGKYSMIGRVSCANNHIVVVNIVHRSQLSGGMETCSNTVGWWNVVSLVLLAGVCFSYFHLIFSWESENVYTISSFFSFSIILCLLWGSVCVGNAVSLFFADVIPFILLNKRPFVQSQTPEPIVVFAWRENTSADTKEFLSDR